MAPPSAVPRPRSRSSTACYSFLDGDGGEGIPVGLLRAVTAVVLKTSNTPEERELADFGSEEQRGLWLARVREIVGAAFPA